MVQELGDWVDSIYRRELASHLFIVEVKMKGNSYGVSV
jgi:hypothetical protein